jgi:outer membrane usher protein FimD/PapC
MDDRRCAGSRLFQPSFTELGSTESGAADLSAFEEKDGQLPGTYRVDIYLNNEKSTRVTSNFG